VKLPGKVKRKIAKQKVPGPAIAAAGVVVGAIAAGLAVARGPEIVRKTATRVATALEKRSGL
jgi:hypothetical protein